MQQEANNNDRNIAFTNIGDVLLNSSAVPSPVTSSRVYTFDEALDKIGFGTYQIALMLVCGAGWFVDGVQLGLVPFILPFLTKEWNLHPLMGGAAGSSIFIGMTFGAYFGGLISDRFGRRIIFLSAIFLTGVSGVASSLAPEFWTFFALRILVGVGLGACVPTDFSLFMEFVPSKHRGMLMGAMNLFWSLGGVFICVMAYFILGKMDESIGWKWLVAFTSLPAVAIFFTRLFVPESPRYLMINNRLEIVTEILQSVAKINKTKLPEGKLVFTNIDHTPKRSIVRQFLTLFSRELCMTTLLLLFIWFMISYGNWGMGFLLPIVFAKMDQGNVYGQSLVVVTVGIVGYVLTAAIMDRVPRRYLMAISMFIIGVLTMCIATTQNETTVVCIAMLVNFFSTMPWATLYTYTPEVYPTVVRASGVGFCTSFTRLAGIISPLTGEALLQKGYPYPFISFGAALILGGIACFFLPIETQGRELRDQLKFGDGPAEYTEPLIAADENRIRSSGYFEFAGDLEADADEENFADDNDNETQGRLDSVDEDQYTEEGSQVL